MDGQRGLSPAEVASRAQRFGLNKFAEGKTESRWRAFVRQYADPMQIVLLVAGILIFITLKELPSEQLVPGDVVSIEAGDPTEGALVALAAKGGVDAASTRQAYPRIAELPFDAAYKLMATFHKMRPTNREHRWSAASSRARPTSC